MAQIKDRKQYDAIMARIDELFFATDENTPTYNQARMISKKLDIDPAIVLTL